MMAKLACVKLRLSKVVELKLASYFEKLGAAFQIYDDILNISDILEYTQAKGGVGEDIMEVKEREREGISFHQLP